MSKDPVRKSLVQLTQDDLSKCMTIAMMRLVARKPGPLTVTKDSWQQAQMLLPQVIGEWAFCQWFQMDRQNWLGENHWTFRGSTLQIKTSMKHTSSLKIYVQGQGSSQAKYPQRFAFITIERTGSETQWSVKDAVSVQFHGFAHRNQLILAKNVAMHSNGRQVFALPSSELMDWEQVQSLPTPTMLW